MCHRKLGLKIKGRVLLVINHRFFSFLFYFYFLQIAQYEAKIEENINRHETAEREIEEVKLEKCSLYRH